MCLKRFILVFIAVCVSLIARGSAFAQQTQPVSDYQEYLRLARRQQDVWEQQLAEQRSQDQLFFWCLGGFLVACLVMIIASTVNSRRRNKESAAKYAAYLEALAKREDRLQKTLEAIERRLGGGT